MRALGALRLLRSRLRIIPDEAAYRALMVACGRIGSDRRVELVKLFGLLRSDGIFPSAVTLGQYTRAIAEGFSKRSSGMPDDGYADPGGVEVTISGSREGAVGIGSKNRMLAFELALNALDGNLSVLEDSGRHWRQRQQNREASNGGRMQNGAWGEEAKAAAGSGNQSTRASSGTQQQHKKSRRSHHKSWLPVTYATSFSPWINPSSTAADSTAQPRDNLENDDFLLEEGFGFIALWSRTAPCCKCAYIPLDEEVQSGWDVVGGEHKIPGAVSCPRCGSLNVPMLGYKVMTLSEASQGGYGKRCEANSQHSQGSNDSATGIDKWNWASCNMPNHHFEQDDSTPHAAASDPGKGNGIADFSELPPQLRPFIESGGSTEHTADNSEDKASHGSGFVTYLSPAEMRESMERYVEEWGEKVLERETLRRLSPELFFNLWWYCARFSLPLPLCIAPLNQQSLPEERGPHTPKNQPVKHYCAFAAWDKSLAEHGCKTGALALSTLIESYALHPSSQGTIDRDEESAPNASSFDDYPLLSNFNLQKYAQADWDHSDLSEILVTLVEACDKRDFRPVVDCVLRSTQRRRDKFSPKKTGIDFFRTSSTGGGLAGDASLTPFVELECYRTMLYLAKYQCTTAFHVFFPASTKPCKGYHFWCAIGTPLTVFDRMFRDAVARIRSRDGSCAPLQDVSDVALGFRCVFGHII